MGALIKLFQRVLSMFDALIVISIQNQKVMEGITFSVRKRFVFDAEEVIELVFDPSAFTGTTIVIMPLSFDAFGGPIHLDVIPGVTADADGAPIPIFNRNFQGPAVETVLRQAPSNIVDGAEPPREILIPSDGAGVAGATGASSADTLVINFDPTKKLLFRFTNTKTTGGAKLGLKFDFFELR